MLGIGALGLLELLPIEISRRTVFELVLMTLLGATAWILCLTLFVWRYCLVLSLILHMISRVLCLRIGACLANRVLWLKGTD